MKNKDKILEELQIQVYTYRQKNGESPTLVISGKFYENLLSKSISFHNINVTHDYKYTLLGCKFMVFYNLAFDEFIVGKGFKVQE